MLAVVAVATEAAAAMLVAAVAMAPRGAAAVASATPSRRDAAHMATSAASRTTWAVAAAAAATAAAAAATPEAAVATAAVAAAAAAAELGARVTRSRKDVATMATSAAFRTTGRRRMHGAPFFWLPSASRRARLAPRSAATRRPTGWEGCAAAACWDTRHFGRFVKRVGKLCGAAWDSGNGVLRPGKRRRGGRRAGAGGGALRRSGRQPEMRRLSAGGDH
ncbi:unnamed protein product [Phaeothamnion confervicola]